MSQQLGEHMNAITVVDLGAVTTNREEGVKELQNWKILKDVPAALLHLVRCAIVANRASGGSYTYALLITHDDQAYAIGDNRRGQLGVDNVIELIENVTKVEELSGLGIIGLSASWFHVSVWTNDEKLFMMGKNTMGELGQGHLKEMRLPQQVFWERKEKVVKSACGGEYTLCVTMDGRVYAWGGNNYRQCNPESLDQVTVPTQVKFPPNTLKIVDVACTMLTSFALTADGQLYAWGGNEDGETGIGSAKDIVEFPTKVNIPNGENVKNISCGFKHCIVLTANGSLFSWGWNIYGEVGVRNTKVARSPMKIDISNVVRISAANGASRSFCKTLDGKIFVWGKYTGSCIPKCTTFKSLNDCLAHYDTGMSTTWVSNFWDPTEPDRLTFLETHAKQKKITFEVEGIRIAAPKVYLQRCSLFQDKLKNEWKQKLKSSGVVTVSGFKAKHFRIFIDYLETDIVEGAVDEDLVDLFKLAHFSKMDRFRLAIIDQMKMELIFDNVVQFYSLSIEYSDKNLEWATINFIKSRAMEFMNKVNWTGVDSSVMSKLLADVQASGAFKSQ